jgi:hypothetical protein
MRAEGEISNLTVEQKPFSEKGRFVKNIEMEVGEDIDEEKNNGGLQWRRPGCGTAFERATS